MPKITENSGQGKSKYDTREKWMMLFKDAVRPLFERVDAKIPDRVRISLSYLSKRTLGCCYDTTSSKDETYEILVRIDRDDPLEIGSTLIHELIHASVGLEHGHKGEFKRVALDIGLEGKMTQTVIGDRLREQLIPIIGKLGPFPHSSLNISRVNSGSKKQKGRMRKAECPACGYVVRTALKWIEEVGAPHCPRHGKMTVKDPPELDNDE